MKLRTAGWINAALHFAVFALALFLARAVLHAGVVRFAFNFFYLDALSAFFIVVIALVDLASALFSVEYIAKEEEKGAITYKRALIYYLLFNLFTFSMIFVAMVNNLGMLWAAVEVTTLVSAFLVGFYNTKHSVEAAWKYIIICSVGIVLALLGTILFSYAASMTTGLKSLNWSDLLAVAGRMDPNMVRIAFVFILVGYGTKAGLAPMHNWLPDAHSQAIAPISALLSGVLLKTAVYAIIRFGIIVDLAVGGRYFGHLMVLLGLISLFIAAVFVLVQKDIKRLLAYSSIEHLGIIAVGLGIGGPLGVYAALLHLFNHAVTKSLMFFCAGDIVSAYNRHNLNSIRGVLKSMPFTGFMLAAGTLALSGFPPFSLFISEFLIVTAAFLKGSYLAAALMLAFIVAVSCAFIYHLSRVIFGRPPAGMPPEASPAGTRLALVMLFILFCALGIFIPGPVNSLIVSAAEVITR
ncbi:MAG TPA: hydrogenase 4 subunit F [Candidatus Omnitrophota bacterium]|nr:hydrogenase 4 subunit F [Candidatus Omnitrophota bacterium]